MTKNAFIPNFLKVYNIAWKLALPFLKKNQRLDAGFSYRTGWAHHTRADLWIQAASAGEASLAVNIIQALEPCAPVKILVTTTTAQGMEILESGLAGTQRKNASDLCIQWFPFDAPFIIEKTVKAVAPRVMVLLETEIWPGLLFSLKQNNSRTMIINARMSAKSFSRYLKTKFLWNHLGPDLVMAVSERDRTRYKTVFEHSRTMVMPNIKFDCLETGSSDTSLCIQGLPLTILASIRQQEETQVLDILKTILKKFPDQAVAVFPRHMHRIEAWKNHLKSENMKFQMRSDTQFPLSQPCIILWDRFGELKAAYASAKAVFVGGSLKPLGGQNFLEPAISGAVTVTGPYYDDFAWAGREIFTKNIVLRKNTWQEVAQTILYALKRPEDKESLRQRATEYIVSRQGGTKLACARILNALNSSEF